MKCRKENIQYVTPRGRLGVPVQDVGLAVHELDVVGTLRIAVAGPVLGAGLVAASETPVLRHLDSEVDSADPSPALTNAHYRAWLGAGIEISS